MNPKNRYILPEWLFKQNKSTPYNSSTVGAFDPEAGLKSSKGFQGRMFAASDAKQQEKKIVLINNPTLRYEMPKRAVQSAQIIDRLIDEGFVIANIRQGEPIQLASIEQISFGDRLSDDQALTRFVEKTHIPADDVVVLNFEYMNKLREQYFDETSSYSINSLSGIHLHADIQELVVDQWLNTHSFPEGHGLPTIYLTENLASNLGTEGMEALLASSFKFTVDNLNIGPGHIPYEKIDGLEWFQDFHPGTQISMPALRVMRILFDEVKDENLLIKIIKSSRQLKSFEIIGQMKAIYHDHSLDLSPQLIIQAAKKTQSLTINRFRIDRHQLLRAMNESSCNKLNIISSFFVEPMDIYSIITVNKNISSLDLSGNNYRDNTCPDVGGFTTDHLETLVLGSIQDTIKGIALLPRSRFIKNLSMVLSEYIPEDILKNTHMPELMHLDMSDSTMSTTHFYNALKLSHNIQTLILNDITLLNMLVEDGLSNLDWSQLSLSKVLAFTAKRSNNYFSGMTNYALGKVLNQMNQLEMLDLSAVSPSEVKLTFEWEQHSFKNLKTLNLRNRILDHGLMEKILLSASDIRYLNLSIDSENNINFLCNPDIILDHLEYLDLSGNEFQSSELSTVLSKTPKLKTLIISRCRILGHGDYSDSPTSITEINISDTYIEDGSLIVLFYSLRPISVKISPTQQSKISTDDILEAIIDNTELIYLQAHRNTKMMAHEILAKYPHAHSLDISFASKHCSVAHKHIRELIIDNVQIDEKELHDLIPQLSNLKVLDFKHSCRDQITGQPIINQALLDCIENSTLLHKRELIAALRSRLPLQIAQPTSENHNSRIIPESNIVGQRIQGVIYDRDHIEQDSIETNLNPSIAKSHFRLKPQFILVQGPDLNISQTRNKVFFPDFDSDPSAISEKPIPHQLTSYEIMPCDRTNYSVYRKTPYQSSFNDPIPHMGLMDPWILIRDLSPNDQILRFETSMNSADISLKRCGVYRQFYLTLKPHADRPTLIEIEFDTAPQFLSAHTLPESIRDIRRPFYKAYEYRASDDFNNKPIKEKLKEIYQHPEFHACEARSRAFAYAVETSTDINQESHCLIAVSSTHAWVEIQYNNQCYTIDLNGAPCTLEYEAPQEKENPIAEISQASAPSNPDNQDGAKEEEHSSSTVENLHFILNTENVNLNILLICNDVKKARRSLRSKFPKASMIDSYEQALSSIPYIHMKQDNQTWIPIEPKSPEGWIANRLRQDDAKQKRIIIDWSSINESQSTKMNSCIDLKNRQLDILEIDRHTHVIGLICQNDPRLMDSSFLSRHSGHIYHFIDTYTNRSTDTIEYEEVHIDLYHSPQWRKLLLGVLGFDEQGSPLHIPATLLHSKKSNHLIINNPPNDDETFDRLIHDLKDGHEFKYHDQSILLPPMKITLTHGYNFSVLKKAILTLTTDVTAADLNNIHIDHVITPSTFERCIETRQIRGRKLITSPGWLSLASPEHPLSLYITRTLTEQQYCFLLSKSLPGSIRVYCAPDVKLPVGLNHMTAHTYDRVMLDNIPKADTEAYANTTIIDVSELCADDLLYRYSYTHDKTSNAFTFSEKISDVWKKLEDGDQIILTGTFSDELMDHLATLLLPHPYLWHDGQKKTCKGKLILSPHMTQKHQQAPHSPITVNNETQRKEALLHMLNQHPIVFIEGKPGIGKSCFIREMKSDKTLNCYSFDPFDNTSLKAWAASNDARPTLLFIDEATELGTDFTMFNCFMNAKRDFLIDGELYTLSKNHFVVPIGNRKKHMPALLDSSIPTLIFETLNPDYVINTILVPIFAEIDPEAAIDCAHEHYHASKPVRSMQADAIAICATIANPHNDKCRSHADEANDSLSARSPYYMTDNRKPVFDVIMTSLQARLFMKNASCDSAKYGGQTGHMLEGLPGSGKSDIIHAAMLFGNYQEVTAISELFNEGCDHTFRYYRIPASTPIDSLRKYLKQAFDQGCIVMIDEFDALLKPDTPDKEGETSRLVAELNAYLMGEDMQHRRPSKPGFMLLATGNGITYHGRAPLPDSLASRLRLHHVEPYTMAQCQWIIAQKFPKIGNNHRIIEIIQQHIASPRLYTFRDVIADANKLNEFLRSSQQSRQIDETGRSSTSVLLKNTKISSPVTMPSMNNSTLKHNLH